MLLCGMVEQHQSALVAESILDLLLLLDLVNIPVLPVGLPADHSQLSLVRQS